MICHFTEKSKPLVFFSTCCCEFAESNAAGGAIVECESDLISHQPKESELFDRTDIRSFPCPRLKRSDLMWAVVRGRVQTQWISILLKISWSLEN